MRVRNTFWIVVMCLLIALPPAQGADNPKPPLIKVNPVFGTLLSNRILHQDAPALLRMIGMEAGQGAMPIQLYQKAALLDFVQHQKAYQVLPSGNTLYPKFLDVLAFLKLHQARKPHDDDSELLHFLSQHGITVPQMNAEFAKQINLQVNLSTGSLLCTFPSNLLGSVTVSLDKIKVVPFSSAREDLSSAVAARLPEQIMTLLNAGNPDANAQQIDVTCSDLAGLRANLAVSSRGAAAMPALVRLEYLYDSATSELTIRVGTLHTVSDIFISRYDAAGKDGVARKRDIERLLLDRLQNREVKRDEILRAVREVVGKYLGSHNRPQPIVINVRYEENAEDFSGLVGLEISEGSYLPRPRDLNIGVETDVPSGRFTGHASLAYQNFLDRGITLSASGSTGGVDGASLQLNAPAGIFRNREWQFEASSARLPNIRLASGLFTEQRNLAELSLPLSSAHPPDHAPFYAHYFSTGLRYRVGQYELTSSADGARQRYTVGVLGFSWRQDSQDYWVQPPTPHSLLDASASSTPDTDPSARRKGRFPFQIDVDVGSKLLGGDQYFLRALIEGHTHIPLSPRWLLAVRASAALSTPSTPILEQPALGGDAAPALLRTFNPEYFRGRQVGSGTVEFRYFTRDDVVLTVGADTGIADGGAAPSHGIKTGGVIGVYWLHARVLGGQSLGLFWAAGADANRWSLALTSGF